MLPPASQAQRQFHLYHNLRGNCYDHVFVRIVCDLDAHPTAAYRSCSGTTTTTGIAIAHRNGNTEPVADS